MNQTKIIENLNLAQEFTLMTMGDLKQSYLNESSYEEALNKISKHASAVIEILNINLQLISAHNELMNYLNDTSRPQNSADIFAKSKNSNSKFLKG